MLEVTPQFGEAAVDTQTGRTVWWDGCGWSYAKPEANSGGHAGQNGRPSLPTLIRQERPALLPLSYAQQRLWFLDKLNGASTEYNVVDGLLLRGELDLQSLQRAVNAIVERHEVLRTHFAEVDGQPVEIIDPKLEIILSLEDVSALDETSRLERLTAAMQWEREQRFELSRGPLFRLKLFRLSSQEHVLLRVAHHIIWDGWSQGIFEREFAVLYAAFEEGRENPLAPLPVQYADFVLWQRAVLDEETVARYLEYWRAQLSGIPEQLNLPLDRPRGTHRIVAGGMVRNALPDELAIAIRQLSYDNHATLYMSLLAAFAVLLNRYSGQDDILVASPIANRHDTQLEQLIGYFVNALVMRTRVNPRTSFRKLLAEVRVTALEAFRHQDVPFEQLRDDLSPERSLSTAPIFQVMFALQNLPVNSHRHGRLEIVPVRLGNFQSRFDLEVYATERESGIEFSWVFNCGLFDQWRIEQMSQNYQRLLQAVLASPDVPLHQLHILTPAERVQLLEQGNGVPQERTPQKLVHQMFQDQVERTPEMIAVECEGVSLSYAELDRRANQLAHYLQGLGVVAEHRVGICMERGLGMMVALLGVLKAGGAYVPFDPAYPNERLVYMAQDSGVAVLLTQSGLQDRLHNSATRVLEIDGNWAKIAEQSDRTPHLQIDPAQLAYVIYTSGSTGKPKGVCVEHRQVCNQLIWAGQALQLTSTARVLQKASFSFDASILEIFLPLAWGARVVVARPGGELDADYLVRLAIEREVTYVDLVPSLLENILNHPLIGHWTSLRVMSSGAEVLKPQLVRAFYQSLPAAVLWNTYGPTEATVQSTFAVCVDTSGSAPIGKPIANTQTYVLDPWLEPTPVGVPGELYIGGAGVARGYWNRPELTAEKFVPNPFAVQPGERLYRTGDLVTWRQDGNLDFVGRVDHQIKVRGYRIELGEIEAVLRSHERVQDALIAVREQSGQKQLLAYVVALPDEAERLQEQASRIEQWRRVYDSAYWQGGASSGDFNIEGWNSSYTGAAIPREEMRTWVEETVKAICALQPANVLEIGCGTGLLLTRLAPDCDSYVGLDFSGPTLIQLGDYLSQRPDLSHVILRQGLAHKLSFLKDDCVDLVILNSVVQYFPNIDYLLQVLAEAVRVTKRGGHIFVGDVRSLPLLDAYHTSVQLYKAAEDTPLDDLRQRVSRARENEEELVLDPGLFSELGRRWGKIGRVSVALKSGRYDNELSRFRYDATLRLGKKEKIAAPGCWLSWSEADHWQQELRHALEQGKELSLGVRGIPDLRVAPAVRAARLLRSPGEGVSKAGEVVQACAKERGADPHMLMELARGLGVELCWQRFSADGVYDAIFNPQWQEQPGIAEPQRSFYRRFGNIPMQREASGKLGRSLQSWLRQSLPDFMLPAAVMVVPAWPLTPSGKIDRQALPTPERHSDSYRAPRGPLEEMLCEIFAEVLSLERVGIDDNFFACGGHSLLAMRLASRVRAIMGMELPIRALFQTPTIAELVPQLAAEDRKTQMPVIAPERPPLLPLSHAQQRLWFINKLQGASPEYNISEALHLRGELNRGALHQAINAIVARHESLRTHFVEVDDDPVQIIEPDLRIDLPMQDLTGLDELKRQEELKTAFRKEGEQAFDLACGPLLRMKLIKLSEHEHVLMRSFHHIISDGWSHGVFTRELMVLYDAFQEGRENPLPPLPVQYPDYALWQRAALDEEAAGRELEYWKQKLSGIPEYLDLPTDRPRPPNQTFAGELCQMILSAETVAAVKSLGQASQTTLYMTLVSVFAVLLHRYSGQKDIVVGSPIANRQDARLEQLIGLFVNSLVLRIQITPQETFREFLGAVRQTALEAYLHQEVPFERLVEALSPQRSLSITPIFQVLFALQNAPMGSQRLRKLVIEPLARDTHIVRLDLEVHAFEREGNIAFYWFYKRELFDRWRVEQMARHYMRLLEAVLANPDQPINHLDLLSDCEKHQVLFEWNRTEALPDRQQTVSELFEAQARRTPGAVALTFQARQLTYAELDRRANQLGNYLRKIGVGPEVRVGACIERGPEMIVALLGILKSGGTHVALDPDFPAERLAYMIQDTATLVVLTQTKFRSLLPAGIRLLDLEAERDNMAPESAEPPIPLGGPLNAAYIIYTSGSTGQPKGVVIEHRNVHNMVLAQHAAFAVQETDRVLQFFSFSFDVSIFATLMALCSGARLVLGTSDELMPGPGLLSLLETEEVTIGVLPPIVLDHLPEARLPKLRQVIVGGESWSEELLKTWSMGRQFFNSYGPTETTVQAAVGECRVGEGKPSIGRPILNARIYLLDEEGQPVPVGVAGELYIAGEGVGRGYLDNALTAEKYLPDPFGSKPGSRMYRTGDWARWLPDGRIDLLGRKDEQVKIRGYRVELGEIESVLGQHPSVLQCAVLARQAEHRERRLVAYVVPSQSSARDGELRAYLKNKLPEYMVPSQFVMMGQLPLNSSGKVDRQALPEMEFGSADVGRPPRTPEEEILCQIFAEVLGLPHVSIDDNFFDLGGHSLMATRLSSRLRSVLAVDLPLRAIFESPTVAGLGPHLCQRGKRRADLVAQTRPERLPMSYAQQRLWFLDQLEGKSTEYHIPEALHLHGSLDYQALYRATAAIVERHEILRTCFSQAADGQPMQVVKVHAEIDLPLEDLTGLSEDLQRQSVAAAMRHEREQPFDLAHVPLLRMKLLKLGECEHILLRTFHHIITDGWSQGIFNRELAALYQAFHEGQPDPLEPLSIQYADFALWQRQWLDEALEDQLRYWKEQLAGIPEELALPKDRLRPARQTFAAGACHVSLTAGQVAALKPLCQSNQTTLYMMLLSAFAVLLQCYSGQDDIVLGSPIANRQEEQLENLMGFFVNSLVLRVRVRPEQSFRELLAQVRAMALEAYRHQDLPFERLVEELSPQRSLNRTPIYQVLFLWQNAPMESPRFMDLEVAYLPSQDLQTHFDIELHAMEKDGTIQFHWLYNRDLFDAWRIQQMAGNYLRLLQAVVATPELRLGALEILDETEKQQLLIEWNRTESAYPQGKPVHRLVEEQVAATPNSVALILGQQRWTYAELNERANQLARYLRNSGIGPESRVAVLIERSSEMIVALLAVWKAGGAYVPLDPAYPAERLGYMLEDAQVAVLLTHRNLHQAVSTYSGNVIRLDEEWTAIKGEKKENLCSSSIPGNLAYVIYTSGSTGKPKGTMVTHEALVNFLVSVSREPGINPDDVLLAVTTLSFDIAALEIYLPLITGAKVVLATREEAMDGVLLARKLVEHGVTMMQATPATWRLLFATEWEGNKTLKVLCGGEALTPDLAAQLREKCGVLWNMYGPTETTVWSAIHQVTETTSSVPLGRPLSNTQLYVLDEGMNPVPRGVAGELYIGGHGIARGYLNRPDLSAQRFVPDPFGKTAGARLYYTGDVVRYRSDGALEFLGRSDYQVKIRGFRIELAEIETALAEFPNVEQAVVISRADEGEEKQLAAYVVCRKDTSISATTMREYLREKLPEHMVPAYFVFMDSLPLTQNGKVNRRALPKPQPSFPELHVAPRTALEKLLAEAWQQALSLERVSLDDNFFDIGGHSLLVARVRFVLGERLKRNISLMDFFTYPTIRSLARRLEQTEEKPLSISDSQERAARQKANLHTLRQRALQRGQQKEVVND